MFSDAIAGLHKHAHASFYSLSFFFFVTGPVFYRWTGAQCRIQGGVCSFMAEIKVPTSFAAC